MKTDLGCRLGGKKKLRMGDHHQTGNERVEWCSILKEGRRNAWYVLSYLLCRCACKNPQEQIQSRCPANPKKHRSSKGAREAQPVRVGVRHAVIPHRVIAAHARQGLGVDQVRLLVSGVADGRGRLRHLGVVEKIKDVEVVKLVERGDLCRHGFGAGEAGGGGQHDEVVGAPKRWLAGGLKVVDGGDCLLPHGRERHVSLATSGDDPRQDLGVVVRHLPVLANVLQRVDEEVNARVDLALDSRRVNDEQSTSDPEREGKRRAQKI